MSSLRQQLEEFCAQQRALLKPQTGQTVGRSASITPSVLKKLEYMLNNEHGYTCRDGHGMYCQSCCLGYDRDIGR